MLELKNPHSVMAVLKRRPRDVTEITISGGGGKAWEEVTDLALQHRVPVVHAESRRQSFDRSQKAERVGSASAVVKEPPETSLKQLLSGASEPGATGLWLALDCLQDPHNVGAIFRTASFFGVRGIILTSDRSAPLTGTVCDVAAGGIEDVPFVTVTNLKRTFEEAQQAGLWVLGSSEHAKAPLESFKRDRCWLLVLGNEERGARQGTLEACDDVCCIKPVGAVTSLNVSVAAGIAISWLSRGG